MKKIYTLILAVCAMFFVGCQDDLGEIWTAEVENYQSESDKVYIDGENFACWENLDQITVAEGNAITPCEVHIANGIATIHNAPTPSDGVTIRAAFPHSTEYINIFTDNNIQMYLPQVQTYKSGNLNGESYQHIYAPMIAVGEKEGDTYHLKFNNASALMKITIPYSISNGFEENVGNRPYDMIIKSIEIISTTSTLWGNATYDNQTLACNIVNTDPNAKMVKLIIPEEENIRTIQSNDAAHIFYVAIPPVISKFQVKVNYAKGLNNYTYTSPESGTNHIARNTMVNLNLSGITGGTTEVDASRGTGTMSDPFLIGSIEELQGKVGSDGVWPEGIYYKQDAFFELPENFAGIGTSINHFNGYYDGNGYTIGIYNNVVSGLFNYVDNAKISNVNVDIDANLLSNANGERVFGAIVNTINGNDVNVLLENCRVEGYLNGPTDQIRNQIGTMISRVASKNSTITLNECTSDLIVSGKFTILGMIGSVANFASTTDVTTNINITNCINKLNATLGTETSIGGMIAIVCNTQPTDKTILNIKINKCITLGTINGTINGTSSNFGGMIGSCELVNGSSADILNCKNDCQVSNILRYGGMIGLVATNVTENNVKIRNSYTLGGMSNNDNLKIGAIIGESRESKIKVSNFYIGGNRNVITKPGGNFCFSITYENVYVPNYTGSTSGIYSYTPTSNGRNILASDLNANIPADGDSWRASRGKVLLDYEMRNIFSN